MSGRRSVSVVICAYEGAHHIATALDSVFSPSSPLTVEAVVVDDGSRDGQALAEVVARYDGARLVRHPENRGICATRNTGISQARHDLVILLDADDRLVEDWPQILQRVLHRWPAENPVCFTACRSQFGTPTVAEPAYEGLLTAEDMVAGRHSGEYLPMMEREWVAARGYRDLGTGKSCGTLTYLAFAQEAPFWVSPEVLRLYTVGRTGSVTSDRSHRRLSENAICAEAVLATHGDFMRRVNARAWHEQWLRMAYHRWRAGKGDTWTALRQGLSPRTVLTAAALSILFLIGRRRADRIVALARGAKLLRRFG